MDLLYHLEGIKNLIIIDAVNMNETAGKIIRLTGKEVPSFLSVKMSPQQIGVPDMLSAAKFKGIYPENVFLWGGQPDRVEVGMDLSLAVRSRVDTIIEEILAELVRWGYKIQPAR